MAGAVRRHPAFGDLRWNAGLDSWEATVDLLPGCPIRFAIVAEADWAAADPADLFETGAAFLSWARGVEPRVRERVADDLLDCYNEVWADDDPDEGPPRHTRADFLIAIRPCGLSLHHDGRSSWDCDPGDLFAGHGIWAMLDAGRSFLGKASLVG